MSAEKTSLLYETRPNNGFKEFIKTHLPRAILYCTVFYLVFAIMPPSSFTNSPQNYAEIHKDISVSNAMCDEPPSIPFDGKSEFTYNPATFPHLSVLQHTNTIRFTSGHTQMIYDDQIEQVSVKFDILFNTQELQDVLWIESEEKDDDYVIKLK
ncbi:hypothetical protein A0J61_05342, partial [Choanephora cucurbitarum]